MAEEIKNEAVESAQVEAESPKKVTKKRATTKKKAEKEVKPEVVSEKKKEKEEPTFKYRNPNIKDYEILLGPVATEKTQNLSIHNNVITLKVASYATANQVKSAVQAIFGVKVDKVNIINVLPRAKRVTRYPGKIPGFKKAYVKINKAYDLGEIAKATNTENA